MLGLFRKDQEMKHKIVRFAVTVLLFCSLFVGVILIDGCKKSTPAGPAAPVEKTEPNAPVK
jgi:hypothetical protein